MSYYAENVTRVEFSNRYGTVILRRIGDTAHVSKVRWITVPPECHTSEKDAARVVLITENRHVQPMFEVPVRSGGSWAFFVHTSQSAGFLAAVESLEYTGPDDALTEIQQVNRLRSAVI